jgi:hypothetical protein
VCERIRWGFGRQKERRIEGEEKEVVVVYGGAKEPRRIIYQLDKTGSADIHSSNTND